MDDVRRAILEGGDRSARLIAQGGAAFPALSSGQSRNAGQWRSNNSHAHATSSSLSAPALRQSTPRAPAPAPTQPLLQKITVEQLMWTLPPGSIAMIRESARVEGRGELSDGDMIKIFRELYADDYATASKFTKAGEPRQLIVKYPGGVLTLYEQLHQNSLTMSSTAAASADQQPRLASYRPPSGGYASGGGSSNRGSREPSPQASNSCAIASLTGAGARSASVTAAAKAERTSPAPSPQSAAGSISDAEVEDADSSTGGAGTSVSDGPQEPPPPSVDDSVLELLMSQGIDKQQALCWLSESYPSSAADSAVADVGGGGCSGRSSPVSGESAYDMAGDLFVFAQLLAEQLAGEAGEDADSDAALARYLASEEDEQMARQLQQQEEEEKERKRGKASFAAAAAANSRDVAKAAVELATKLRVCRGPPISSASSSSSSAAVRTAASVAASNHPTSAYYSSGSSINGSGVAADSRSGGGGLVLSPMTREILSTLRCICGAAGRSNASTIGGGYSRTFHTRGCYQNAYVTARGAAESARESVKAIQQTMAREYRSKRHGRALGGVMAHYADRLAQENARLRAANTAVSHALVLMHSPGLRAHVTAAGDDVSGSRGASSSVDPYDPSSFPSLPNNASTAAGSSDNEIDLHGQHASEAVALLESVLPILKSGGQERVSIITGRGSGGGDASMRRAVHAWLHRHKGGGGGSGGSGAVGIRIRSVQELDSGGGFLVRL